jgi:hypothetical protein
MVNLDGGRARLLIPYGVFLQTIGRITSIQSIRSYAVGAEHGANIITAIVTVFGERNFRRTLENFNRRCNYLLYYGVHAP